MNPNRIRTVMLHTWYHLNHSLETWIDLVWFPIIQFLVFGLIAAFLAKGGKESQALIMGYMLWVIIEVGNYSIAVGALWEVWSKSLSSLFITPLTLTEFVAGQMVSGAIKATAMFLVTSLLGFVFYKLNIFSFGIVLLLYLLNCLLFSWTAGMFILGLIIRYGTGIQSLSWGLIFLVQPMAAVFFPLEVLPDAIRLVSHLFPVTYVFEAAREQLFLGTTNIHYLLFALVMNLVFIAASYLFMQTMFSISKKRGSFVRMEN